LPKKFQVASLQLMQQCPFFQIANYPKNIYPMTVHLFILRFTRSTAFTNPSMKNQLKNLSPLCGEKGIMKTHTALSALGE
ncbi:MAG: hypothetical protein AAB588_03070, partial [Patescibacteria group bacterium]